MADLTPFEESLLNDLEKEVISRLVSMYRKEVTKKVYDLIRDSTPFKMAVSVILCLNFLFSIMSFFFLFFFVADSYFR